jgi:hypothetical protein
MKAALAVALLALWFSSGCGGGPASSSGETSADQALSQAEFSREANQVCYRATKEYMPLVRRFMAAHSGFEMSPAERLTTAVRAAYLPRLERVIREIRALGAPPGEAALVGTFLRAQTEAISRARRGPIQSAFDRSGPLAERLGWPSCDLSAH